MNTSEYPIVVRDVWKDFRVFSERNRSLKEVVLRRKRASYESFWALKGVSFQIPKGITFGLIGENGSGKSTMLKIMANILRPQKGTVDLTGKVSALLELGAGFHPDLTGRENIFLNGSILGLTRKEISARFDDIVEFSELRDFIDTPVKTYSSGMYVRLGFAVAINVEPDILLIDEILAVGDEAFQRKCLNKLYELKNAKKTIVMVSHALESVRSICDEAVWLEHGQVRALGPARQVVDAYLAEVNRAEEEQEHGGAPDAVKPEVGTRFGSGEVVIEGVDFLDMEQNPRKSFHSGERFAARIYFDAKEKINRPVFGTAIHTRDGIHVNGTNTRIGGVDIESLSGRGYVDFIIEDLPLLTGDYLLTAAVYDYSCLHPFDQHDKRYAFRVNSGNVEDYGILKMPCAWEVTCR